MIDDDSGTIGATVGDLDGDGTPDLAFGYTEEGEEAYVSQLMVFLNWSGSPAPPCVVPFFGGYYSFKLGWLEARLPVAMRRITRAGCTVGTVTWRHSRKIPAGHLITHRPHSNTVLASGARVDLVVSLGRRKR